jgi:SAM-dependent methyltransferase
MDRSSVRFLCCPQCSATLIDTPDDRMDCSGCSLTYPIRDGVPVLVIGEATSRLTPTDAEFERLIGEAVGAPFQGWDLSWLDGRRTMSADGSADPTHHYDERAMMLVAKSSAVLDIGTGDGRRFARFAPFRSVAVAAEGYAPNVLLAKQRLEPLGIHVVRTDENCHNSRGPQPGNRWPQRRLPFAADTFDLVLASRAAFAPREREVARVLRSGGTVLTLQGNTEWRGETLADALGGTPPDWTLPGFGWDVGDSFRQAGLNVVQWTDYTAGVMYHDIGAVVFELLHVPWGVVDFDLDRYRERLFRLHRRMQAEGDFRTRVCTNLIEARKP